MRQSKLIVATEEDGSTTTRLTPTEIGMLLAKCNEKQLHGVFASYESAALYMPERVKAGFAPLFQKVSKMLLDSETTPMNSPCTGSLLEVRSRKSGDVDE